MKTQRTHNHYVPFEQASPQRLAAALSLAEVLGMKMSPVTGASDERSKYDRAVEYGLVRARPSLADIKAPYSQLRIRERDTAFEVMRRGGAILKLRTPADRPDLQTVYRTFEDALPRVLQQTLGETVPDDSQAGGEAAGNSQTPDLELPALARASVALAVTAFRETSLTQGQKA